MSKSSLLNVLLAIALVILSAKTLFNTADMKDHDEKVTTESAVLDNIKTRTSIRAYENREIEDDKVETLLQAAMAAPTAGNKQPWEFVVIKNRATLDTIASHFETMTMAKDAPLAIVVCGDINNTFPEEGREYWVQDASAATENLLLAAHAMGLGAVWCGIYPISERVEYLKKLLDLPENIIPLNVIPIGYPGENPQPKDKWKAERVHYESWNGKK
jgi:nitroreductase